LLPPTVARNQKNLIKAIGKKDEGEAGRGFPSERKREGKMEGEGRVGKKKELAPTQNTILT